MEQLENAVPVEVKGLMVDPSSNLPIVLLHDPATERYLPIWIGLFEAQAIAMRLEGIETPRPMTHDLLYRSLHDLGAKVRHVIVCDLRDSTFLAEIHLEVGGQAKILDARPSDAIALALRADAPLFVAPEVLENALTAPPSDSVEDRDELRKWLEDADPEVFGKYKM